MLCNLPATFSNETLIVLFGEVFDGSSRKSQCALQEIEKEGVARNLLLSALPMFWAETRSSQMYIYIYIYTIYMCGCDWTHHITSLSGARREPSRTPSKGTPAEPSRTFWNLQEPLPAAAVPQRLHSFQLLGRSKWNVCPFGVLFCDSTHQCQVSMGLTSRMPSRAFWWKMREPLAAQHLACEGPQDIKQASLSPI